MKKILLAGVILFVFSLPAVSHAALALTGVKLTINPQATQSSAVWTIEFTMPETKNVGHILISLGGHQPDLSRASATVSGLSGGTVQVGKTNPNCISNCDDLRYILPQPIFVKKDTKIIFTVQNVINPEKVGQTGINFINVFSSKYPALDLAFSSGSVLLDLQSGPGLIGDNLIPGSVTSEDPTKIQEVLINELFYKEGAKTTKLTTLADPSKVEDFTLDLLGKVKVVFKAPINLANEEAVHYIANLADYATFEHLYFWIDPAMTDYFKVPLEITYYDVPFVGESDVLKEDQDVLDKTTLEDYKAIIVNNSPQISFRIKEGGGYRLIPIFKLEIDDNQEINTESNQATFNGRISDTKAIIKITLNSKELTELKPIIDAKTGNFSVTLDLTPGPNLIKAEAQSSYVEFLPITKIVQYNQPGANNTEEKKTDIFDPLYYVAGFLILLAVVFIFLVVYLIRRK